MPNDKRYQVRCTERNVDWQDVWAASPEEAVSVFMRRIPEANYFEGEDDAVEVRKDDWILYYTAIAHWDLRFQVEPN